jgi:hypothetical protein
MALAVFLFRYRLPALFLVEMLILGIAYVRDPAAPGRILQSVRRLRWLLLSIAVIYLWIAPEPVPGQPGWLPRWPDIAIALERAGVLVVLVSAVELLRQGTRPEEMAAALMIVLRPLGWMGVDVESLSRRIALTLETVPRTAELVTEAARSETPGKRLAGWAEAAARLVRRIETEAAGAAASPALPALSRPGVRDWALLVPMLLLLAGLTRL